jgi:hypothetical protein
MKTLTFKGTVKNFGNLHNLVDSYSSDRLPQVIKNQKKFWTKKILKPYIQNMDMQDENNDFHIKDLQDVWKTMELVNSKQKTETTATRIGDACFIIECLINNLN